MSHALATVRHDGRRPSVTPGPRSGKRPTSREAATDNPRVTAAAHAAAAICRPFRAGGNGALVSWGSRPRLWICRAFGARSQPNPHDSLPGIS